MIKRILEGYRAGCVRKLNRDYDNLLDAGRRRKYLQAAECRTYVGAADTADKKKSNQKARGMAQGWRNL